MFVSFDTETQSSVFMIKETESLLKLLARFGPPLAYYEKEKI